MGTKQILSLPGHLNSGVTGFRLEVIQGALVFQSLLLPWPLRLVSLAQQGSTQCSSEDKGRQSACRTRCPATSRENFLPRRRCYREVALLLTFLKPVFGARGRACSRGEPQPALAPFHRPRTPRSPPGQVAFEGPHRQPATPARLPLVPSASANEAFPRRRRRAGIGPCRLAGPSPPPSPPHWLH